MGDVPSPMMEINGGTSSSNLTSELQKTRRKKQQREAEDVAGGGGGGDVTTLDCGCGESQWLQCEDQTDGIPESLRFNWFDILCIILSITTYVVDLGMDIYVSYVYYCSGYYWYFALALIFIIIPSVSMTAFSLRWYVTDMDNQTIPKPSCTKWIIRTVFLLLQLAPVLRYFDALIYGLKSRKAAEKNDRPNQYKYYAYMINEDADSTLLRLFEAFMESAPQVTLQLYILIYHFNDPTSPFKDQDGSRGYMIQVIAVLSSLVSLAWSLSVYHRSIRYAQQEKINISYKGTLLQFVWHICSISARVFALAVFAATHPLLIFPVCIAHWCAMVAWLIVQRTKACENHCEEALFNLIVAFIYVFTFFNVRDEPTRYKYLTFYIICFLENSCLLFTWFFSFNLSTPDILWFRISGLVGDYAVFFLGILSMVLYYVYFHPSVGVHQSDQKNPTKAPSNASISFPSDLPVRSKALARKGSMDTSQLAGVVIGNGGSSSSHQCGSSSASRSRNVNYYASENSTLAAETCRQLMNSIPKVDHEDATATTTAPISSVTKDQKQTRTCSDETRL